MLSYKKKINVNKSTLHVNHSETLNFETSYENKFEWRNQSKYLAVRRWKICRPLARCWTWRHFYLGCWFCLPANLDRWSKLWHDWNWWASAAVAGPAATKPDEPSMATSARWTAVELSGWYPPNRPGYLHKHWVVGSVDLHSHFRKDK